MRNLYRYLLIIVIGTLVLGCDVIEGPFMLQDEVDPIETSNPYNVLLIDFTGHTCKSCPKAHRMIKQIQAVYGDRINPIAFHMGYFARVTGDLFVTDFNTPEGDELEPYYEIISYPIGLVNTLHKDELSPYPGWSSEVAEYIELDARVRIEAESSYQEDSQRAEIDISLSTSIGWNDSEEHDVRLAIYLTESHIIAPQKDEEATPMDVVNYEHNHVFRTAFGGYWGESIDLTAYSVDNPLQLKKTLEINPDWVADNCHIVIFAYENDTKEVLQSIQIDVKQK